MSLEDTRERARKHLAEALARVAGAQQGARLTALRRALGEAYEAVLRLEALVGLEGVTLAPPKPRVMSDEECRAHARRALAPQATKKRKGRKP